MIRKAGVIKRFFVSSFILLLMTLTIVSTVNSLGNNDNKEDVSDNQVQETHDADKEISNTDSQPDTEEVQGAAQIISSPYATYTTKYGDPLVPGNYIDVHLADGSSESAFFWQMLVNGKLVYCLDRGIPFSDDQTVEIVTSNLNPTLDKRVAAAMYYGEQTDAGTQVSRIKQVVSQTFVWATMEGIFSDAGFDTYFADVLPVLKSIDSTFDVYGYYETYKFNVLKHATVSSFENSTQTLTWNDTTKRYEAYFTDTESVANRFTYTSSNSDIVVEKIDKNTVLVYTSGFNFNSGDVISINAEQSINSGYVIFENPNDKDFQHTGMYAFDGGYKNTFKFNVKVVVPEIKTSASDQKDGDKEMTVGETVTITDVVSYTNLIPGKLYTLNGTLMDKSTGALLVLRDGTNVRASTTFIPDESSGTVRLDFTFNSSGLWSKEIVVFEDLYYESLKVATHSSISDAAQTVHTPDSPEIKTDAFDVITNDSVSNAEKDTKIIDRITHKNLEVGQKYFIRGTIVFRNSGTNISVNDQYVVSEREYSPSTSDGTVNLEFAFNASEFKGKTVVVYEEIYLVNADGSINWSQLVASHKDLADTKQTIYFPKIETLAKDGSDGDKVIPTDKVTTIVDTVKYEGLAPGKLYTISGVLMDKATGLPLRTHNGDEVRASKPFTPTASSGTTDLVFTFDASLLYGKEIVVFEDLYFNGKLVESHTDINDENQTVTTPDEPEISTSARDSETGGHIANADNSVTIIDTVSYKNLEIGKTYTISGVLMDKSDGSKILVNGQEVVATINLTPTQKDGTIDLVFTFDATTLEGKTIVVFERMYKEGIEVAHHTDIDDTNQTIHIPEVKTSAKDGDEGDSVISVDEEVRIIDVVTYKNLIVGKKYTVNGVLMDKSTNAPLLTKDGHEVHASKSFTATKENGSIELEFVFNSSTLWGKEIVVFETVYYEGKEVAFHHDIEDKNQTVTTPEEPEIKTLAKDSETMDHISNADASVTIIDTVTYKNLEVGKEYVIKGVLMDKDTGLALLVDGKEITAMVRFKAKVSDGTIDLSFTLDASLLRGKTTVVFETLYRKDVIVATHHEINDAGQTVHFPEVSTSATDKEDGDKDIATGETVTIVDEVTYKNLIPGKKYTISGVLMDKSTNKPLLTHEGKEVRAEKTFTATTPNGVELLEFTFDSRLLYGKEIVVFETVYYEGKEVAVHHDIEDKNQTVTTPKEPTVGTTAKDSETLDHISNADENVTIIDTVKYSNLEVGKEYTIIGTLMNYGDGTELLIGSKKVTATVTFIATSSEGTIDLEFTLNATTLKGKTVIVFERLYKDQLEVANHTDINDMKQSIRFPELKTNATNNDKTSQIVVPNQYATVVDSIEYTNLLVGKKYTVKGVLMDKATGKELIINGASVRAETSFTPTSPNGVVEIVFRFDASSLSGKQAVVFERVFLDGKEVGSHQDINDAAQTVSFRNVPPLPSTGLQSNNLVLIGSLATITGISIILVALLRKHRKEN